MSKTVKEIDDLIYKYNLAQGMSNSKQHLIRKWKLIRDYAKESESITKKLEQANRQIKRQAKTIEKLGKLAEMIDIHCSTESCKCGESCNNCNAHYSARDMLKITSPEKKGQ